MSTNSGLSEPRLTTPQLRQPELLEAGSSKTGSSGRGASAQSLTDIRAALGDCRRCNLSAGRRQIVFGSGNPGAKLVFVGEGPGYEEDLKGEPFVGPAGQLLTKIIGAIGMTRDAVYILNVVKCRPPKNRNPLPDEVAACEPFMNQQIRSIKPDYICALGKFAAQTLLKTDRPISRLRGQFFGYHGIELMPTFHPSYLLRNPDKKREVWQDMQKLMAAMKKRRDAGK
jgi:DNA polymerase